MSLIYNLVTNDTQYHEKNELQAQTGGSKEKEFQLKQNIHKSPFMVNPYKRDFPQSATEKLKAKEPEVFHIRHAWNQGFIKPFQQTPVVRLMSYSE